MNKFAFLENCIFKEGNPSYIFDLIPFSIKSIFGIGAKISMSQLVDISESQERPVSGVSLVQVLQES